MTLVYRVLEEKCLCVGGSTVRETMIFLAVKDVRLVMGAIGCLVCESRGKDKLNQAPPNVHVPFNANRRCHRAITKSGYLQK